MSDIPLNREPLTTIAETIILAGDMLREQNLLGIGGVYISPWVDVSAYPELRLRSLSDVASAAGGVVMQWSYDNVNPIAPAAITAAAAANVIYDSGIIARAYNYARIGYANGANVQTAFRYALEGYPIPGGGGGGGAVNATIVAPLGKQTGAASVAINDNTETRPTHGVTVAVNTDNSTLIATVQVGYLYRIVPIGTEGVVWTNSAGPAARATDEPLMPNQKDEFIARHVSVYAQKLVAGTANGSVNVVPRDGGTIA